jgi:hypothetical protein
MSEMKQRVEAGWTVVDPDGNFVGTVEQVREDHLIVAQGRVIQHTLYVPIDHLTSAADGQVTVNIPAGQIEAEGWRYPPNAGFSHGEAAYPEVPVTTTQQAAGMSAGTLSAPEIQGAVYDGKIDPGEVPNTDVGHAVDEEAPDDDDDQH